MQSEMLMRAGVDAILVADDPVAGMNDLLAIYGLDLGDGGGTAIGIELPSYRCRRGTHAGCQAVTLDVAYGFNRFG